MKNCNQRFHNVLSDVQAYYHFDCTETVIFLLVVTKYD